MREIKFRYWDLLDGKLKYVTPQYQSITSVDVGGQYITIPLDDIELMQYTGLKDKNGVEIYEGDILSRENNYENNCTIKWDNESCGFTINYIYYDEIYDMCEFWDDFEIIGNIHENHELLEV